MRRELSAFFCACLFSVTGFADTVNRNPVVVDAYTGSVPIAQKDNRVHVQTAEETVTEVEKEEAPAAGGCSSCGQRSCGPRRIVRRTVTRVDRCGNECSATTRVIRRRFRLFPIFGRRYSGCNCQ